MSSLAHCLGEISNKDLSEYEKGIIQKYAEQNRKEGFKAKEANINAVNEFIRDLDKEEADILGQVEKAKPARPGKKIPLHKPTTTIQAKTFRSYVRALGGINPRDPQWHGEIKDISGRGAGWQPGVKSRKGLSMNELFATIQEIGDWKGIIESEQDIISALTDNWMKPSDETIDEWIDKTVQEEYDRFGQLEEDLKNDGATEEDIRQAEADTKASLKGEIIQETKDEVESGEKVIDEGIPLSAFDEYYDQLTVKEEPFTLTGEEGTPWEKGEVKAPEKSPDQPKARFPEEKGIPTGIGKKDQTGLFPGDKIGQQDLEFSSSPEYGLVFIEKINQVKAYKISKNITRGKQAGKVRITLPTGKKYTVPRSAIRRVPVGGQIAMFSVRDAKQAARKHNLIYDGQWDEFPGKPYQFTDKATKSSIVVRSLDEIPGRLEKLHKEFDKTTDLEYSKKKKGGKRHALRIHRKRDIQSVTRGFSGRELQSAFAKTKFARAEAFSIVSPETKEQRTYQRVAKALGLKTVFFKSKDPEINRVNGLVIPHLSDRIFVNVNRDSPLLATIGHEITHTIQLNFPDLYQFLDESIRDNVVNFNVWKRELALSRTEGMAHLPESKVYEELYGNFIGDQLTKPEFWDKLNGKSPTLTHQLAQIVKRILDKLSSLTQRFKADFYFKDIEKAQGVVADVLGEYSKRMKAADPHGIYEFAQPAYQTTAWHGQTKAGKPITQFDPDMVGTGAGLALGWGVYISEEEGVARFYAKLNPAIEYNLEILLDGISYKASAHEVVNFLRRIPIKNDVIEKIKGLRERWKSTRDDAIESEKGKYQKWIDGLDRDIKAIKKAKEIIPPPRNLYEVSLGKDLDDMVWLEWGESVPKAQLRQITKYMESVGVNTSAISEWNRAWKDKNGRQVYESLIGNNMVLAKAGFGLDNDKRAVSTFLSRAGIDGVKAQVGYFGGNQTGGKYNYVVFDPSKVKIVKHEQFSYAGQRAETADKSALAKAVEMEQAGKDTEEIRKETGWFLNPYDSLWRFEIDDSKLKMLTPKNWDNATLDEIINHPELFKAYPELRKVKTDIAIVPYKDSKGSFDGNTIIAKAINQEQLKETLLHEIQHAIQEIEGFARGGSPERVIKEARKIVSKRKGSARKLIDQMKEEARNWIKANKMSDEPSSYAEYWEKHPTKQEVFNSHFDVVAGPDVDPSARFLAYQMLAGEIESRDVSERMPWGTREREAVPPYWTQGISKEDAIVRFRGEGAQMSTKDLVSPEGGELLVSTRNLLLEEINEGAKVSSETIAQKRKAVKELLTKGIKAPEGKKLAFHGTPEDFEKFDYGVIKTTFAMHFTDNPLVSLAYALGPKGEIHVVEIDFKNPLIFETPEDADRYATRMIEEEDYPPINREDVAQMAAKDEGYDGIIIKSGNNLMPEKPIGGPTETMSETYSGVEYIPFASNQINIIKKKRILPKLSRSPSEPQLSLSEATTKIKGMDKFREWFGKSKVVDEQGEPLVVYHGTTMPKVFDEFGTNQHFGTAEAANDRARPLWSGHKGPRIIPVYLKIENPFRAEDQTGGEYAWDDVIKEAKRKGHDGVVYTNQSEDAGSTSYIAFNPTQIKSIFNQTWSPTDPRISYSTTEESFDAWAARMGEEYGLEKAKKPNLKETALEAIEFEQSPMRTARAMLIRHFNDAMYWVVDKNRPIATVQKYLSNVTDDVDVFLKETQRPKITAARVKAAWADEVKPLIEKMSEYKINVPDLEVYKHALHAQEANAALRRSNAKLQVEKIIKALELGKAKEQARAIKKAVKDLEKPDEWYNSLNGIIKKYGTEESLQNTLARWKTFSNKPSGMTDAEAETILKQHKGDKKIEELGKMLDSINDNSLALMFNSGQIAVEEYEAILNKYDHYVPLYREGFDDWIFGSTRGLMPSGRAIKTRGGSTRNVVNILAHSIANYEKAINRAEKARSQRALHGLIEANPESDVITIEQVKKAKRYDPNGNLRMYPNWSDVQKNEMRLMVDGKQYLVSVQRDNKDAMLMMRTLKAEDGMTGPIVNTLAKLNRFLAKVNTTWSPEFIISNFIRDFQTAGINIQDTGVKGKGMLKGAKDAWKAIFAIERDKPKGTEIEGYYKRFKAAGGKIGWSDVHGSVESLSKKIKGELKMMQGKRPARKVITEWLQLIENINTSIENGIRLHVFKLAVDQGKTDERAAQIASDLTVDFTKKGAAGPVINSLYLFANAGIQGSYRIFRAASKSRKVQGTLAGIVGVGFAVGVLNALAGGEDDDGEDYFNKIDDYIRERNMIIMLPGTKGRYVKIPLPWGYNVFWNIGSEASRAFTKENYSYLSGAGRLASTFADAFNPVASGTLLQTLSPTVADPFVQVAENKNWFGGALMPERNKFDKTPDPDSQRYWKSAGVASKWVTSQLNSLTGGDKIKPGLIDVSPATLDLVVDTVGGSAFRFVKDTLGLPIKAIRREEIEAHKIPFARRVAGEKPEWADSRIYYENMEDVLVAKERLKVYKGTVDYGKLSVALKPERSLIPLADRSEKRLRTLRKRLKRAKVGGNKGEIERVNKRIKIVYTQFNKRYNETMGK